MSHEIYKRKLRAGIVGGGSGAFIGAVHRIAAELDGQAEIQACALSSDPIRAMESAAAWYIERGYESYITMAETECQLKNGIDFVIVATPNNLHFAVAKKFLENGINVVCDKPMTFTIEEAKELIKIVEEKKLIFALTHTYTGYPCVRHAREIVKRGELGDIRKVVVEYHQDWLMEAVEKMGNKQAAWRTDPNKAGISCCVGDIGTHGENMVEYITGLKIKSLCADFTSFVAGRQLEDDANILLRLENGGKGILSASQIACGEENNLRIRIYGSKASLEWGQQEPNTLIFKQQDKPWQHLRTGHSYMSEAAKQGTRVPNGHPEGYFEAFANIYKMAIQDIRRLKAGEPLVGDYPNVYDGLRGMQFVVKAVESAKNGATWVEL